jgi:lipoprotein-releasing system ATP-binding protein
MGLTVEGLSKAYATRSGPLAVLSGITLNLADGEALAVMGPSGSGKSTLLNILGTLEEPSSGTVLVDGRNPFALPEPELAAFRNRHIGFVFQDHHLLPQCSVLENVLVPTLVAAEGDQAGFEAEARRLLDRVGLSGRLDHRPAELSGGERQRAAIARALIRKPRLLLADEPTGNLDRKTAHGVGELLTDLYRQEGATLVVVTHSPDLARLFPRRAEMTDGRLETQP